MGIATGVGWDGGGANKRVRGANKRVRGATKNSCAAFNWKAHEKINLNHRVLNAMHSSESCYIPFYLRFQMSVQNIFSAHFFSKNGQENSERVP